MGFETLVGYFFRIFFVDYKTVPMGFETQKGGGGKSTGRIIRQSLWDLKLEVGINKNG